MNNSKLINNFILFITNERKFSKHTIRSYKFDLNEFDIFLKEYDKKLTFFDIERSVIQFYIKELLIKKNSDKTLQRKIASIKSFYKYLSEFSKIECNVADLISIPKTAKYLPNILSKKEVFKLMSLPDLSSNAGIRDKSILELFYSTGMRIAELTNLQIEAIDLKIFRFFLIQKASCL